MSPHHLLEVDDLTAAEVATVLDLAEEPRPLAVLGGLGAALLFEKPSARTRHSTEMAVVQLGGHPIYVRPDEVGLDQRETVEDVTRTLCCYHAVLCARVFQHRTLERMAAVSSVPVVNLLSEAAHPLQALADLLTLRQHVGRLDGVRLAWIGDFTNVARSLALGVALTGGTFSFGGPEGYGPSEADLARVARAGGSVEVTTEPKEAVAGAQCVVTDAWYAMGQEAEIAERRRAFAGYTVDAALMAAARPDAVFLHCLPAHRGEEVADEVIDGPQSLVWAEARNRMHAARGALALLLGAAT